MILEKIVQWVTNQRYFVVFLVLLFSILGAISLKYLPIDAVPDITNNQVQINASVSGFSPVEMEKQVTFPIETALSGIPGLQYTRSLSRNGFSQVTAVFNDDVNIYFARQQVSEKLTEAKSQVFVTTHSPMFFSPQSTGTFIKVFFIELLYELIFCYTSISEYIEI